MNRRGARSWAEIDCAALRANARRFKKRIGNAELIAVVKANAYGHGAPETAAALQPFVDRFAVASPDEAAQLREAGVQKPILLLYPLFKEELEAALMAGAEIAAAGAAEIERADQTARRLNAPASVHIALNTGMNRYGADPSDLPALVQKVQDCPALRLAGISTHLTEASLPDSAFTQQQLTAFQNAVRPLRFAAHSRRPLLHAANTAAVLNVPESALGAARVGIGLYGVYPHPKAARSVELEPVLSWKTRIASIVHIKRGGRLSYNRSFTAERPMRAAVVPVGYADGFRPTRMKPLTGERVNVLTCGRFGRILGGVMMDAFMFDVTDIPEAQTGTEATLLGGGDQRIGAAEAAAQFGTHPYELLAGIGGRVQRIYMNRDET